MSVLHVLGAGAFGSALARVWDGAGHRVALHGRGARPRPAPGDVAVACVPAQATGGLLAALALSRSVPLVLCAKGLELGSGALQTEIAARHHCGPLAVLTGPSLAAEIGRGLPTALTLACADPLAETLQARLAAPTLRLYLTDDLIGAQLGGALKNVYAIACGAAVGAGLGESARAALMTRGFAEMVRIGTALGGRAETFAGLSGLGDLALSCASPASRNFALGMALGAGRPPPAATQEGRPTAMALRDLAARRGIDAPIATVVAELLDGAVTVAQAMARLLARPLIREN
ncbi:MAG: NAD(P)H-dependent glycerol-3-phosphate dehydrogenase [Alphaproteobacteria bacterium]|nr:MAG: NAD(P)H-dependent glycerol-3-phosphate dehydrogenase [Alphaproteobacteria bacterium]